MHEMHEPKFEFGNEAEIEVDNLILDSGELQLVSEPLVVSTGDLYADENIPMPGSQEWEAKYAQKLAEIRDNWRIAADPEKASDSTLELTIANASALGNENGSILRISTSPIPDDPVEAIELAHEALANPDHAIIHVVAPGWGGSTGLSKKELAGALHDGLLVSTFTTADYDALPAVKSVVRTLGQIRGKVSRISSDYGGAHFASALMSAEDGIEAALFYSPTNISDFHGQIANMFRLRSDYSFKQGSYRARHKTEIGDEEKYAEASTDPLAITPQKTEEAIRIIGKDFADEAAEQRSAEAASSKAHGHEHIFGRGMDRGQAAVHHIIAALRQNPMAQVTYIFPEFAAHYEARFDIIRFMDEVFKSGRDAISPANVTGQVLPVSDVWGHYHPLARLALERHALNR